MELIRNQKRRFKNMLYKHFAEKLIELQDIEIEKIEEIDCAYS